MTVRPSSKAMIPAYMVITSNRVPAAEQTRVYSVFILFFVLGGVVGVPVRPPPADPAITHPDALVHSLYGATKDKTHRPLTGLVARALHAEPGKLARGRAAPARDDGHPARRGGRGRRGWLSRWLRQRCTAGLRFGRSVVSEIEALNTSVNMV